MKACTKCSEIKPLVAFEPRSSAPDGRTRQCRDCINARQRLKRRASYAQDSTTTRARVYEWREANLDKHRSSVARSKKRPEAQARRRELEQLRRASIASATKPHDAHCKAFAVHQRELARLPLHDAHVREAKRDRARWFRLRYRHDPVFQLKQRIRAQLKKKAEKYPRLGDMLRAAIARSGKSSTVERVCGAPVEQIILHLERQFTKGMTWAAFLRGEIHIDHIVPRAAFNLHDESEIAACWSIANLRPLWAKHNLAKSDRRVSLV